MRKRRAREDDYIGPSRGWAKWLHRLAMFILWPLRRPVAFLLLAVVLFLAPTFMGIKPAEVHLWYWNKIKSSSAEVSTLIADKTKALMPDLPSVEMPSFKVTAPQPNTEPAVKVIDMPVKEVRRKMFEKAASAPVAIDILRSEPVRQPVAVPAPAEIKAVEPVFSALQPEPRADDIKAEPVKKKLALVYLDQPRHISGSASVVNANEIKIGDESLFLYGIYVDPNTVRGQEGKIYLDKTISGQVVDCQIKAYTYQGVATGICLLGQLNLNQAMVRGGFSKNVALD